MEYDYYPTLTKLSDKTKPSLPPRHRSVNGDYSKSVTPYLPNVNGKNMGDYWNEDIVRTSVANQKLNIKGEHPAPFPNEIITLPILQTSKEFELVLDPFMGSGTTGRVCDQLGRNFVGYDVKMFYNNITYRIIDRLWVSNNHFSSSLKLNTIIYKTLRG